MFRKKIILTILASLFLIFLLIGYTPQLAAGNQLMGFQGARPLLRSAGFNTQRKQGSSERQRTLRGVATPRRYERAITRAILFSQAKLSLASNMAAQLPKHYILSMPDSLKDHYGQLRKKYYYEYASNRKNGDLRYYTAMTLHDAGLLKWPECDYYGQKYGVMCNRISSEKLHDVLHYIYNNYPGSCAAEKIFNYVKAIVPYKGEKGDYPRFPLETLYYHGGDCEDSASAVAALLKMAGYTTALYTIHDYDHDIHHCVCVCKVPDNIDGDKWRIKEYYNWGYCWLILDPAYHHSFGDNPSWVKHYLQSAGLISIPDKSANCLLIDFDAYKTFCEKMDK